MSVIDVSTRSGLIGALTVGTTKISTKKGVNYSPASLSNWRSKLAGTKTGNATLAVVGDSISVGNWSSDITTSTTATNYVGLIRTALQAQYGDGGSGFIGTNLIPTYDGGGYVSGVSCVGAWTFFPNGASTGAASNGGPSNTSSYSSTIGNTITYTGVRGQTLTVYYINFAVGSYTVTVDGTVVGTVTTTGGGAYTSQSFTIPAGSHTVVLTITSSAIVVFFGIRCTNPTGVIVDNYSHGGETVLGFSSQNTAIDWSGGVLNPCDLYMLNLGVNDCANTGGLTSSDAYISTVFKIFDRIKNGPSYNSSLGTDFAIALPAIGKFQGSDINMAVISKSANAICNHYGGVFIDMGTATGNSWLNAYNLGLWGLDGTGASGNNSVHPSNAGHAAYAQTILSVIQNP
jgi:lysophospholipase L1-like esterase